MSTEGGNYRLITVHAPFPIIAPTDRRLKIQEDVLRGILPKLTVPTSVTHCAFIALQKFYDHRLSQIFLRLPKQYFVFDSSPKQQTQTVCNNRPNHSLFTMS